MRKNPERTAWIILWVAFTTFCIISLLVFSTAYWYVFYDTVAFTSELTSVRGVVVINDPLLDTDTSVIDGNTATIREGLIISTDDTSQAILTFLDDGSLTMYGNTTITIRNIQLPRFPYFSYSPTRIVVILNQGRVRTTVSRGREQSLHFDLIVPPTTIELGQGSFSTEVNEKGTQLTTRLGQAEVIGRLNRVTLPQNRRLVIETDGQLSDPLPASQNLIGESVFSPILTDTWKLYDINLSEGKVTTQIKATPLQGRTVLELLSLGEDNTHTEIGVVKEVNKDVRDFRSLRLSAEVRLMQQSLEGGGQQGSEFPIMLNIAYKDADGNDRNWFHGFYYKPPLPNYILYNQPDNTSERIARYIWYPYESENLLTTLGPAKPVFIKSIRIYGSGWIYQALVANISLLGEE